MATVTLIDVTSDAEHKIAEAAGICYASTATGGPRLVQLIKKNHLSCLRFANATVKIEGVSRACTHQLVRHANFGDLQESQRHVPLLESFSYVTPPAIVASNQSAAFTEAMKFAHQAYVRLIANGIKKEDARYVLPNACCSAMAKTANFQAWWQFLYGSSGRLSKHAQWEIRDIAQQIENLLARHAPNIFGSTRQFTTQELLEREVRVKSAINAKV